MNKFKDWGTQFSANFLAAFVDIAILVFFVSVKILTVCLRIDHGNKNSYKRLERHFLLFPFKNVCFPK